MLGHPQAGLTRVPPPTREGTPTTGDPCQGAFPLAGKGPVPWESRGGWPGDGGDGAVQVRRAVRTRSRSRGGSNSSPCPPVLEAGVRAPGAGRAGPSRGLSPGHVDGHLPPASSQGRPSVCVCVLTSSAPRSPVLWGQGPTPVTSLDLNHLLKDPVSKRSAGVRTPKCEFGDTAQPTTGSFPRPSLHFPVLRHPLFASATPVLTLFRIYF